MPVGPLAVFTTLISLPDRLYRRQDSYIDAPVPTIGYLQTVDKVIKVTSNVFINRLSSPPTLYVLSLVEMVFRLVLGREFCR